MARSRAFARFRDFGILPVVMSSDSIWHTSLRKYSWRVNDKKLRESVTIPAKFWNNPT
jgi:hypothetical protein